MMTSNILKLGYELDDWNQYGRKVPITIDISPKTNSHILLSGLSGSGKSYAELGLLAKIAQTSPNAEILFCDFKREDSFAFLRGCAKYFPYKEAIKALDIVYDRLQKRQSGQDETRNLVLLAIDEYAAWMYALLQEDKKHASLAMSKMAEILQIGRSMNVKTLTAVQRPDAEIFPKGARGNYGVGIILGSSSRSTYEMLLPSEYMDEIKGRKFGRGEGVLLLQGSELHFVKIPTIQDEAKLQEICKRALS